jgi:RNA polymerase sigma factor (TIGR02999 family)
MSHPSVTEPEGDITALLSACADGEHGAGDRLYPLVYQSLRRMAAARLAQESASCTLSPTELVHEAWFRLGGSDAVAWSHRRHFFAAAAQAMRRILVEQARRRLAAKRGAGQEHATLHEDAATEPATPEQLLMVDQLLSGLAARDPSAAEVVELRYFAGLEFAEIARVLDCSERTALRRWTLARAWIGAQWAQA